MELCQSAKGVRASATRTKANTNPDKSPICSPDIAIRWARFAPRRSLTVSNDIADLSPVVRAAAKPPASPSIPRCTAMDNACRTLPIHSCQRSGSAPDSNIDVRV
ncbi:MAG: hypothetical protein EBT13_04830 [Rhodobacteraceae bacterium]|nr:hypothetical protein [Paracoccaceae bacterium]